mmetsp:Transcript_5509/g.9853  ORF Transcript_5509/g.9853 Transcript_5509/m.9853 type:complete len:522 (+) Transcript_5509:215-1780(+)
MSVSQAESSVYSRSSSGTPETMPTEIAATASLIGDCAILPSASSRLTASWAATKAPVIAAVRVPPSACNTSQSSVMVRSPSRARSNTARSERPIRRWISCVRPLCLPLAASRSPRVWVARGSMPYSAVTQPSPEPRLCGGTRSSTEAVQSTRVAPNSISTEPSACTVKPRVMRTGRSWLAARPALRVKVWVMLKDGLAAVGAAAGLADDFVDLAHRALDLLVVHGGNEVGVQCALDGRRKAGVAEVLRGVAVGVALAFPLDREHRDVVAALAPAAQRLFDEFGRRFGDGQIGNLLHDFMVLDAAPQAVRAQQQPVGGLQRERALAVHHGLAGAAQAGEEHVAVEGLTAGPDPAQRLLEFRVGMVARAGDQLAAAHHVEPRITAMRPPGLVALQHAGDHRGARRVGQALARGVAEQLMVCDGDALLQEPQRVFQHRARVLLEQRRQRLQRDLGGDFAFGMPTHAVGQREQTRLARVAIAHAVFVGLAASTAADLEDVEPQAFAPDFRFSSCSLSRSLKDSLV